MSIERLKEPAFLILSALAGERLHGYALLAETERLSSGRLSLRPGSLYAQLDRLLDEGLVVPDGDEIVDGRARRYYTLSESGATTLAAEAQRMQHNVDNALSRLRTRELGTNGTEFAL